MDGANRDRNPTLPLLRDGTLIKSRDGPPWGKKAQGESHLYCPENPHSRTVCWHHKEILQDELCHTQLQSYPTTWMAESESTPVGTVYDRVVSILNAQDALPQLVAIELGALIAETADRRGRAPWVVR